MVKGEGAVLDDPSDDDYNEPQDYDDDGSEDLIHILEQARVSIRDSQKKPTTTKWPDIMAHLPKL